MHILYSLISLTDMNYSTELLSIDKLEDLKTVKLESKRNTNVQNRRKKRKRALSS